MCLKKFILSGNFFFAKLMHSIIDLYQNLLNRFPDKEGFYYFYSKLSNNDFSIIDIENAIKESSEYLSSQTPKLI